MKKGKIWALAALCASVVLSAGTAAACSHKHEFGAWSITTAPTENGGGTATRECKDGDGKEEMTLPKLTDSSFWTLSVEDATHTAEGKKTYTSEYGNVEVVIPTAEHTFGGWTITKEPDMTNEGLAVRECSENDGGSEEKILPVLTDKIWTAEVKTAATHEKGGVTEYTSVYGKVIFNTLRLEEHNYGKWQITEPPALTDGGKARRECTAGDSAFEEIDIPALSDESVWTRTEKTPATHLVEGEDEYASEYGTVTVATDKIPHAHGGWKITLEPTKTAKGTAVKSCECGDKITQTVSELTDVQVWELKSSTPATATEAGSETYSSVYGEVTVAIPRLSEPYYNKDYYNFGFDLKVTDRTLGTQTSWDAAHVALDGEGKGKGNAYPFFGDVSVSMKNYETGEVEIVIGGSAYKGFVDAETGIMVMTYSDYAFILTTHTYETEVEVYDDETEQTTTKTVIRSVSDALASGWSYSADGIGVSAIAIDYNYAKDKTLGIYYTKDRVYFGVTFNKADGSAVSADKCFQTDGLYIKSGNEAVASFGYDGAMHALDGLEGEYTDGGKTLVLSGFGKLLLDGAQGAYELAAEGAGYTLAAYAGGCYYEITLGNGTFTAEKPMVTVTFEGGEYADLEPAEYNVNIGVVLPVPESTNAAYTFIGWFTDAQGKTPVALDADGKFVPETAVTLYAQWEHRVLVYYVLENGGEEVLMENIAVGDIIGDKLPELGLEEENGRYFGGWYLDAEFETPLPEGAEVGIDDSGIKIYAKWIALPDYYGVYGGRQLLGNSAVREVSLTIDQYGKLSGTAVSGSSTSTVEISGAVTGYNPATNKVEWKADGSESLNYFIINKQAGMLVMNTDWNVSDEIDVYPNVYVKDGVVGDNVHISYKEGSSQLRVGTYFFDFGDGRSALIYKDAIFADVTAENAFGESIGVADVASSKTLVIRQGDEIVLAIGTSAANFGKAKDEFGKDATITALDAHYGEYDAAGISIRLDGLGNISWIKDGKNKSGIYSFLSSDNGINLFDVFERERKETIKTETDDEGDDITTVVITYENVAHYYFSYSDSITSFVRSNVTLTYSSDGETTAIKINKHIPYKLSVPENTQTHVFRGWYLTNDFSGEAVESVTLTEDTAVYAKWLERVVLTIDYKDGEDGAGRTETLDFAKGETALLTAPVRENYRFVGWRIAGTDEEWNSGSVLEADTSVYAVWTDAPIYSNLYGGILSITDVSGSGTDTKDFRASSITFNPDGTSTSTGWPFNGNPISITSFDAETGRIAINSESAQMRGEFTAYIDKESYMIVVSNTAGLDADISKIYVLITGAVTTGDVQNYGESYWNDGKSRAVAFNINGKQYNLFIHDNAVHFNVTFGSADGGEVAAKDCYRAETLYVRAADGSLIAKFGYNGTTMVQLDGYEDITYTGAQGDITVNGNGAVTISGVNGTYTLAGEDAGYTADAYVAGSYYELTLDKQACEYTLVKRMVTVAFVTEYDAAAAVGGQFNKNIAIDLPALTDENYIFRGWYAEDESVLLNGEYVPTQDITLTAKWDVKATLTVVYGNGLQTVTIEHGVGDTVELEEPAFKDCKIFDGWFTDDTFQTPYTPSEITENTTVYCKWKDAVAQYGTYGGFETWGKAPAGGTIYGGTSFKTMTIDDLGNVKIDGSAKGTITSYDEQTGELIVTNGTKTYRCSYDSENGIIAGLYTTGNTIGDDLYLFFLNATAAGSSSSMSSYWNSGLIRLMEVNVTRGEQQKMNVFVYNEKIYANVSWASTDGEVSAKDAYKAQQLSVFDSDGNLIAEFVKKGTDGLGLPDESRGTYVNGDDSLSLDGGVTVVWGDKKGTYKAAAEGADYDFDLTFANPAEYYRLTLNGNAFTVVKPVAEITFDLGGKGENFTYGANLNVELDLRNGDVIPDPTAEGFIFKGWYDGEGGTGTRVYTKKPVTADPITIYAKWVGTYKVTYAFNDGSENRIDTYEGGTVAKISEVKPECEYVNGKYFAGWYLDEEFTEAVSSLTVEADATVYAKWEEGTCFVNPAATNSSSKYAFVYNEEGGYYASDNKKEASSTARMTIKVYEAGTLTFKYQASSESDTRYDYLKISLNGSNKATAGGKNGLEFGDGPSDTGWSEFVTEVKAGDLIEILYIKDGSTDTGADTGWIKDIVFQPANA